MTGIKAVTGPLTPGESSVRTPADAATPSPALAPQVMDNDGGQLEAQLPIRRDSLPGRQDPTLTQQAMKSLLSIDPKAAISIDANSNTATFLSGRVDIPGSNNPGLVHDPASAFLGEHGALFGVNSLEMLEQSSRETDDLGITHTRYRQVHRGLPVFGQELIVHHRGSEVTSVGGRIVPNIELGVDPALDRNAALEAVRRDAATNDLEIKSTELGIFAPETDGTPRLAYRMDVDGIADDEVWRYVIDARQGSVIDKWTITKPFHTSTHTVDTPGATQTPAATTQATAPTPPPANPRIASRETYDAENNWMVPGKLVRKDNGKPSGDPVVDAAHDNIGKVADFFMQRHDRDSYDGKGGKLVSIVHYRDGYNNAFWDGRKMTYGDGDGKTFTPFPHALDVVAHELSHGVTERTAGLEYYRQPGALNESFSDVYGELIEQWAEGTSVFTPRPGKPTGAAVASANAGASAVVAPGDTPPDPTKPDPPTKGKPDWLIGEDVFTPGTDGDGLRNMAQPGTAHPGDPQPGHMRDYVETDEDNGGVHINSGIPNRAAYLVASRAGAGVLDQVWYRALTKYLTPRSHFLDAANSTVQAARDLYGPDSEQVKAVATAWTDVGLTPAG